MTQSYTNQDNNNTTEIENDSSGFFMVIPSTVYDDPDLEQGAIIFYGRLSTLWNKKGYCWATNDTLSKLCHVCESTIKNWLKSLSDSGHIIIETDKEGVHWQRKIWNPIAFQKNVTKGKNLPPPSQKFGPPQPKICPSVYNDDKEYTNKDIQVSTTTIPPPQKKPDKREVCESAAADIFENSDKVQKLSYISPKGEKKSISISEIYSRMLKYKFPPEILNKAIEIISNHDDPICDIIKYLTSICERIINEENKNNNENKNKIIEPTKIVEKKEIVGVNFGEMMDKHRIKDKLPW